MNLRYAQLARPVLARSRGRTAAAVLVLVAGMVAAGAGFGLALTMTGGLDLFVDPPADVVDFGPLLLTVTILSVPIIALPAAMLTARWVLRMTPGRVCSVAGRFRWAWFARCLVTAAVVVAASVAVQMLWSGAALDLYPDRLLLVAVVVCCVPVAAFAEEFVFRGVLTHIVGAHWARGLWAVAVPAVLTSVVFAVMHGSLEPAVFTAAVIGGLAYSVLCDRTGGVEASTAAHIAWNTALFTSAVALPAGAATSGSGMVLGVLTADVVVVLVLTVLARSRGLQTTTPGPARPGAASGSRGRRDVTSLAGTHVRRTGRSCCATSSR